jgi:hypothetical protein
MVGYAGVAATLVRLSKVLHAQSLDGSPGVFAINQS